MALDTKYTGTFYDYYNRACVVNLQFDGSFSATTLNIVDVNFEWQANDLFTPVRGSSVKIDIAIDTYNALDEFFTISQRECFVEITLGGIDYWKGWVLSGDFKRAYAPGPTIVSIIAVDGLGLLRSQKYWNSGTLYVGRTDAFTIIDRCLSKVGFDNDYYIEIINVYEDSMSSGANDSPLKQTYLDQDAFIDYETLETISCYEVLERVLTIFNACVFSERNSWWLIRIPELYQEVTYRQYGSDLVLDLSGTTNVYKELSSNDAAAADWFRFVDNSGILAADYVLSELVINRIKSTQLVLDSEFEGADSATDYWTPSSGGILSLSTNETGNKALKITTASSNLYATYTDSWGGSTAITGGKFRVRYKFYISDSVDSNYYVPGVVVMLTGASTYYLKNDGSWTTTSSLLTIDTNVNNEWIEYDFVSYSLPSGSYSVNIRIYGYTNTPACDYVLYDYIMVDYIPTSGALVDSIESVIDIDSNNVYAGQNRVDLNIDDQSTSAAVMWKNSLQLSGEVAANTWEVDNSYATNLRLLMADVYKAKYIRPTKILQGTVRGQTYYRNLIYDGSRRYFPTRVSYNMPNSEWSGEWIELAFPAYGSEEVNTFDNGDGGLYEFDTFNDNGDGSFRCVYDNTGGGGDVECRAYINSITCEDRSKYEITIGIEDEHGTSAGTWDFYWGGTTESGLSDGDTFYYDFVTPAAQPYLICTVAAGGEVDYTIELSIKKRYGV